MEYIEIGKLKESTKNPRRIDEREMSDMIKSVEEFPEMLELRPIVVNESNVVIGGTMRFKACQRLGWGKIPIVRRSWEDDKKDDEFTLKDNISFGRWDWDRLANEFEPEELRFVGISAEAFEPKTTPEQKRRDITEGDMKHAKDKLEHKFDSPESPPHDVYKCQCPNCGRELEYRGT